MPNNNSYRDDSMSSSSHHRSSSGGGRHNHSNRRGTGRRDHRPNNITNLPFEQGIICSLKESFGFIHCAERPEEIFFHYSEVTNCHPDEMQIDTEVEFKVGSSGGGGSAGGDNESKKFAAFQVKTVEKGTVVWETEEEEGRVFKGFVEKPVSIPRNSARGFDTDGTIRIIVKDKTNGIDDHNDHKDEKVLESEKKDKPGPVVRLRAGEYSGARVNSIDKAENEMSGSNHHNSKSANPRLFRNDFIEFRVLIDRRTKQKYARSIKLIESERDRKRTEKEKVLLEKATSEEGIIYSLNNGFGFIKSNRRREDVYFNFSQVIEPQTKLTKAAASFEKSNNDDDKDNNETRKLQDCTEKLELSKGQEVKFLVVTEPSSERQHSTSNIQQSSHSSGSKKISARQVELLPSGSVFFHTVEVTGVKGVVTMVPHPPSSGNKNDDSKEGRIRLVESLNTAEKINDDDEKASTLDEVVLHYSDAPGDVFTYQNHRNQSVSGLWIHEGDTLLFDVIRETVDGCYRAIPTLHTIQLGGSILEPNPDNRKNGKVKPVMRILSPSKVGRAEGIIHALKPDYGFIHYAERPINVHFKFYDLMPDELQCDIRKYIGIEDQINLEEGVAAQFDICAHGNIAATSSSNRGRRGRGHAPLARENIRGQRVVLLPKSFVTFDKLIATGAMGVVKSTDQKRIYAGALEMKNDMIGMTMDERHPLIGQMLNSFLDESSLIKGRKSLVFRDTLGIRDDDIIKEMVKMKGKGVLECSHIPVPGISPHPGRLCIRLVKTKGDSNEIETKDVELKGKKAVKVYRNIFFDKTSLDEALKEDVPPCPGDAITCDVFQSRRTGNFFVRNLKITERKILDETVPTQTPIEFSVRGVVKDIVARRNFGFISIFDDTNARELIFFHLLKDRRGDGFSKGTEVKFDIAIEGSKRIAINVESLPKGTIPSVASKNACLGYILMEPSHTSLSNTPVRKARVGSDKIGNGRWAETNGDTKKTPKADMVEDGCIVLLEDKTGMFQKKREIKRRPKRSPSTDSIDSLEDLIVDDTNSVESGDGLSSSSDDQSTDGTISSDDECLEGNGAALFLSRISYKIGSIAIHGPGSTSSMDNSINPRRGDLISFIKGRKRNSARDIRVVKRETATLQRGRLENIRLVDTEGKRNKGIAQFIAATEKQEVYDVNLAEVVSCIASILKEKESVEGILHEGRLYGICRTSDLYLASRIGSGKNKQRPKLNLNVKKDRGGTIMAQSMMAKGPDGTIGFKAGWTGRPSQYEIKDDLEESQ